MSNLILIDGNSLINRAFYATPLLTDKDGNPTNAVYGFMGMLIKLIGDYNPDYMLVAFDRKEPTFRHKMYAEYKGTRKPMPDELRPQIGLLKETLKTLGICAYEKAGVEADDIIGTLAKKFDLTTYIVTGDRDSFQLVDESTTVLFTKRGITDLDVMTNENFYDKMKVTPKQIIDLKACMGDSSDNIPGIAGVGEKTAVDLIEKYGSLDGIYENAEEIKGKLKEKVLASKDIAYLSRSLATIDVNVEIPLELKDMKFSFPFPEAARKFFVKLEFKNILKRDGIFMESSQEKEHTATAKVEVQTIENYEDLTKLDGIKKACVYIDKDVHIYPFANVEYMVKIRENLLDFGLSLDEVIEKLQPLFEDKDSYIVVYDKKSFMHFLQSLNVELKAQCDDVMLEKYLADFSGKEETVPEIIEYYDYDLTTPAYSLYLLHESLKEKIAGQDMQKLYSDVELPLCSVLFDMENCGFKIDMKALDEMSADYSAKIAKLLSEIRSLTGEENLNPNSTKQLGEVLFVKLGLKSGKKTKSGYSTNAEVLESIADSHPVVPLILKYRQLQKLNSTYVEGFRPLIDRNTGLVHTCFNQALTQTGRLSSKEPNLQNIPVRDEEGKEIRKLFTARGEGRVLVSADYSQIELRLMAHFSGCKTLIEAYKEGKDIHSITASQVFGVPLEEVTPQMRRNAKAVNFGIIYGISDFGLSKSIGTSVNKAGEYIKAYFANYPEVKEYMDKNVEFAKQNGYVSTLLGRRRYIREINSPNYMVRSFGERAAMNMPLQGTSADIIKIAMINVYNRLKTEKLQSKLILQIHDELIIDAPESEKQVVGEILKEEMENAVSLSVPLTVEVSSGKTWYEAK